MNTQLRQLAVTIVTGSMLMASCSKKSETVATAAEAKTTANLVSDPSLTGNHYAFYSLETGQPVAYTDSATTKWDIGFRSTTIIVNGGTSGPGGAGAFVQTGTTFAEYAQVADSTFKVDNIAASPAFAIPTGSGNGWYNYNTTTNVISPIPGRIIVIRTATGKYAKLEITSYYKDAPATPDAASASRYYNFRYAYQSNGTKKF